MKKIKSAAEIAMEKAQNIQGSREEARSIEQKQYEKAAIALGRSLLQNKTDAGQIKETIQRYPEAHKKAAVDAFVNTVKAEMDLDNTPRILEAIMALKQDEKSRADCEGVQKLYEQYRQQRDMALEEMEKSTGQFMKKKLARTGIAGSAIAGFNLKQHEQSKQVVGGITKEYRDILAHTFNFN